MTVSRSISKCVKPCSIKNGKYIHTLIGFTDIKEKIVIFIWTEKGHKLCRLSRGEGDQKLQILHSKKTTERGGGSKIVNFEMT